MHGGATMSESQSRYSIIERLTDRKLSMIDERDTLELDAQKAKQEVEFRRKNLEIDKKSIAANAKRKHDQMIESATKEHKDAITDAENNLKLVKEQCAAMLEESKLSGEKVDRDLEKQELLAANLQVNLKVKKDSINTKIAAIEEALKRLEEVSKTAPQN
jgi:ATP-dependent exoDNAse (exonuclease V) alpha subunit